MGINLTNTGQKTINKWVTGKRDIGDLIKKYNVPSEEAGRRQQPSSNTGTWRRRRAAAAEPNSQQQQQQQGREWVDERYIKTYTEYSEMLGMFEDITKKYPKISERYGPGVNIILTWCPASAWGPARRAASWSVSTWRGRCGGPAPCSAPWSSSSPTSTGTRSWAASCSSRWPGALAQW